MSSRDRKFANSFNSYHHQNHQRPTEIERLATLTEAARAANVAIEALLQWRSYLHVWMKHPNVPDSAFMAAIQDMAESGLTEFLEGALGPDLDLLRQAVTRGKAG